MCYGLIPVSFVVTPSHVWQQHHWHIANILKGELVVHNDMELCQLVRLDKRSYFVTADFERAFQYLKRVGAIRKRDGRLRWVECNLTLLNMEFLNKKSKT
jgi:hypothetical protein